MFWRCFLFWMTLQFGSVGAFAQSARDTGARPPSIGAAVPVVPASRAAPPPAGVRDLKWEALVPADWSPRQAMDRLNLTNLSDNDPRANDLLAKLRAEWDRAPVVKALAGQKVRLPGYIVSLEGDAKGVREFLLVPYFGACIHLPPPPSNQVVHVFPARPVSSGLALAPVWVSGVIETTSADTEMGSASYRIRGATVEAYLKPNRK